MLESRSEQVKWDACSHLEDVVGTLAAQVVLAGQDDHGLGEHLQADGADQLLLQVLHRGSAAGTGPRAARWGWPEAKREAHHPAV